MRRRCLKTPTRFCRVEAGLPAPGAELTEDVTPLEAGLRRFCDDHKGCYTGQEIVARQITYDKVANHLVGLLPAAPVTAKAHVQPDGTRRAAEDRLGQQCSAQPGAGSTDCPGVREARLQRSRHPGCDQE